MEGTNLNFDISLEHDTSKEEDKGKKAKIQRRKGVPKKAELKEGVNNWLLGSQRIFGFDEC